MTMIHAHKAFCLDENYKFPICWKCKCELTPFFVNEEEILKIDDDTIAKLFSCNLLYKIGEKNLLFLCKKCLSDDITKSEV